MPLARHRREEEASRPFLPAELGASPLLISLPLLGLAILPVLILFLFWFMRLFPSSRNTLAIFGMALVPLFPCAWREILGRTRMVTI